MGGTFPIIKPMSQPQQMSISALFSLICWFYRIKSLRSLRPCGGTSVNGVVLSAEALAKGDGLN